MGEETLFKPVNPSSGYLTGQLLISTPQIQGTCFHHAVIYMLAHDEEGAMGLIINKVIDDFELGQVLEALGMESPKKPVDVPVFYGGPVDAARGFVLHTQEYEGLTTQKITDDIALTCTPQILQDIAMNEGPRKHLFVMGYAGWSPGQLEQEIEANSWISVDANESLVFDGEPEKKWQQAAQLLGIDLSYLSETVGHA